MDLCLSRQFFLQLSPSSPHPPLVLDHKADFDAALRPGYSAESWVTFAGASGLQAERKPRARPTVSTVAFWMALYGTLLPSDDFG